MLGVDIVVTRLTLHPRTSTRHVAGVSWLCQLPVGFRLCGGVPSKIPAPRSMSAVCQSGHPPLTPVLPEFLTVLSGCRYVGAIVITVVGRVMPVVVRMMPVVVFVAVLSDCRWHGVPALDQAADNP